MRIIELPRDLDSEKGLLSVVSLQSDAIVKVVDLLQPDDFYDIAHQQIWQAMVQIFKEGNKIDVFTLRSQLDKQNSDSKIAKETVMNLFEYIGSFSNVENYARKIKNKSLLRKLYKITQVEGFNSLSEDADAQQLLVELEKEILEISDSSLSGRVIDSEGIITEVNEEIATTKEKGWLGLPTGFDVLDEATGGLVPSQTWIVGAYTGGGKTFFILQILLNVLRKGGKVALFSTEMDRKTNMLRLIGNIANLGVINMMRGKLLEWEENEKRKAEEELKKYKDSLSIFDNVYTVSEIRLKAKKLKMTQGLDVIAVDFIQNLRGQESIYERMSEAAISLQQLAQELQVTIIIGSQVSQNAAGWRSKDAIEYKGAGEIAAIADVALWLLKLAEYPNLRRVAMRKLRHGEPKQFDIKLDFPSGRIEYSNAVKQKQVSGDTPKEIEKSPGEKVQVDWEEDGKVTNQLV